MVVLFTHCSIGRSDLDVVPVMGGGASVGWRMVLSCQYMEAPAIVELSVVPVDILLVSVNKPMVYGHSILT